MSHATRVLVVDDEPRMAEVMAAALGRAGHTCEVCNDGAAALTALDERGADVVVTDWKMPDMDGLAFMKAVHERRPALPVILVTAHGSVPAAVAAMRDGAFDYLTKPFDNDELRAIVARALELTRLERENRYLRQEIGTRYGPDAMIAASPQSLALLDLRGGGGDNVSGHGGDPVREFELTSRTLPAGRVVVLDGSELSASQHRKDARHLLCRCCVNLFNLRMRVRRANKQRPSLARTADVVGVLALAGDEAEVFLAAHRRADSGRCHEAFLPSSGFDGFTRPVSCPSWPSRRRQSP